MPSRVLQRWGGLLSVVGLWALFFAPHLLSDGVPYYRDQLVTLIPIRHYLHERLLSGELPMWYPFESLGVPFIGQIVTATFHPQTLLFLPLSPALAVKFNLLGGYLLGAGGAYALCRALGSTRPAALCGACALGFGGYALGVSNNLVYLMGLATLPWVAWASLRVTGTRRLADAALLMVAWALVFLAGDAQMFAFCPLLMLAALCVHGVTRRSIALLALAGVGTLLLISAELLPALAVSGESMRGLGEVSTTLGRTWALHPLRVPELLIPGYVPDAFRNQMVAEVFSGRGALWSTTVFAGALVVLLTAVGLSVRSRATWAFGGIALLGLWLSLGDYGGLLPLTWKLLPLLSKFRFPEKYLALFWLGLAPLVALGADALAARRRPAVLAAAGAAAGCAVLAALAWNGVLGPAVWRVAGSSLTAPLAGAVSSAWGRGLACSAGFLAAAAALIWASGRRARVLWLLPLLVFAELLHGNGAHLPLVSPAELEAPNAFATTVLEAAGGARPADRATRLARLDVPSTVTLGGGELWVRAMRQALRVDSNGPDLVAVFGTNLPATPARYGILFGSSSEQAAPWAPAFNGCFWTVSLSEPLPSGLELVSRQDALGMGLARGACLPRAYVAGAVPAGDMWQALRRLRAGLPPGMAVVEGAPALASTAGEVQWLELHPERLRLAARAPRPSVLVINDQFARGWSAFLDGAAVPLLPANVAARALPLPPGEHEVELRYATPNLGWGLTLSAVGLLLALALVILGSRPLGARQ
ncbi:YfhO family protein [Aggregicoccus sp. 17bor-14]|uniref:hypothetical protein n=1 Tax=Myxococcaceae TaxID=31 RepID=UPI00129CC5EA|nr:MULTISPECIES: hypothetical protein [Myxococcaceae]MBF5044741.1 hypothetical protein [Simulacricoccus sp. 17bor-14]MRI90486.1 YfhO family protein [Aggregicoccus sp. 17bor-14]